MKNETGFTLIEVLVAVVILAVGLLGVAGLQARGLRNNLSAYQRSQATQLTYDMTDRMRANKAAANNYLTSFMAPTTAVVQGDCLTVSTSCTAADMAQNDLFQWNADITSSGVLTSGIGTINVSGTVYAITITWDDDRDGDVDTDDPSFSVSFEL